MLTSKIISEIIENQSEVSGCANSCNKCFSSVLVNHEITYDIFIKRHRLPRYPFMKRQLEVHSLTGIPGFNRLEYIKRFEC